MDSFTGNTPRRAPRSLQTPNSSRSRAKPGITGAAPKCITDGRNLDMAKGLAAATNVTGTSTIRINGEDYTPTTPDPLIAKIKEIVG
jgi:hypothetical protein